MRQYRAIASSKICSIFLATHTVSVCNLLSNMELLSTEFLEEERDDFEQYYVNEFVFFKMSFLTLHNIQ